MVESFHFPAGASNPVYSARLKLEGPVAVANDGAASVFLLHNHSPMQQR